MNTITFSQSAWPGSSLAGVSQVSRRTRGFAFVFASLVLGLALSAASVKAAETDEFYHLGPDSMVQEGVPQGKIIGPLTHASEVYPNTTRNYWVYVPAQYDPSKPAALMIYQDGHAFVDREGSFRIPTVFDNLIYRREMPVTIGVFINPGRTPDQQESSSADWGDRVNNRAMEYNPIDDKYPRMIVEELVPALKKDFNISDDPAYRAIAGHSSGAIAGFTVAWFYPNEFSKVLSTIGSFVNLRGGHMYPQLILENDPKPIRVFLQDGLNDNRGRGRGGNSETRDWHAMNRKMAAALEEKGYDVNYVWGIGTHSGRQSGAMQPEMLRWLWRDYYRPDDPTDTSNRQLFEAFEGDQKLPVE